MRNIGKYADNVMNVMRENAHMGSYHENFPQQLLIGLLGVK
jgi:hypothetical protein